MDRRRNANSDRKKTVSPSVISIAVVALLALVSEGGTEIAALLILLVILALPILIVVMVVKRVMAQRPAQHSHDRIDHSRDLKINPETGRVEQRTMQNTQHTPQEHWRQQLDGLLANGTIDRNEYRTMMNRKF